MSRHIIVKAKEHSGVDDLGDIYLLYRTETIEIGGDHFMVCHPVENPQKLVGNSQWITHDEDGPVQKVWHYRKASSVSDAFRCLDAMNPMKIAVPKHVLHAFIECSIEKKTACPITLEPLTKDTVAYTACGHLFQREAIDIAVRGSGKCPTCRAVLGLADICGW